MKYIGLNQTEYQAQPYHGNDSARFVNETGDTFMLVQSDTSVYYNYYESGLTCTGYDTRLEGVGVNLTNKLGDQIIFNQYMPAEAASSAGSSEIAFYYQNAIFLIKYISLTGPYLHHFSLHGQTYDDVRMVTYFNDSLYYSVTKGLVRLRMQNSGKLFQRL